MWDVAITGDELSNIDKSIKFLAPGASKMISFISTKNGDLVNNVQVKGRAAQSDGSPIPGAHAATARDISIITEITKNGDTKSGDKASFAAPVPSSKCLQNNFGLAGNKGDVICSSKEVYLDFVTSETRTCIQGETITVSINASVYFQSSRYDVGWYVATDGGDSLDGTCAVNGLQKGNQYSVVDDSGGTKQVGKVAWDKGS